MPWGWYGTEGLKGALFLFRVFGLDKAIKVDLPNLSLARMQEL